MRDLGILAQSDARHLVENIASWGGLVLEAVGVAVLLVGAVAATASFLRGLVQRERFHSNFVSYRRHLGRAVLLGLEFLVAADIIGTVLIDLSFHSLGVLAILIVVRTFLSFALTVEIEGRWPWQRDRAMDAPSAPTPADA